MLPIKSSTVSPLSGLVVTFLNTSPAVFPFAGVPAWPNNGTPLMQTTDIPATHRVSRLDQNFIFNFLPKGVRRTYRTNDGTYTQPCYRGSVGKMSEFPGF